MKLTRFQVGFKYYFANACKMGFYGAFSVASLLQAVSSDGQDKVSLLAKDGTVWCTQAQMAELFDRSVSTISRHIANILKENELNEKSNLRFLQIATVLKSHCGHIAGTLLLTLRL